MAMPSTETDVLLLAKSGAVVGELNHSRKFPALLRPFVAKVVHGKIKKYLNTPLKQTGHLPPCGLSADKGTYKHRSRQFLSCVVIMPGGNNWLEVLTCGQPAVTQGSSGLELANNIKGVLTTLASVMSGLKVEFLLGFIFIVLLKSTWAVCTNFLLEKCCIHGMLCIKLDWWTNT